MRSYLLKINFISNLQKHHFAYVYKVIIKCYLNFVTCLYFSIALITWNSSHYHQMELFKSEESFKKIDSKNNWKFAWPRMILEWHLFLRLSLEFVWEMFSQENIEVFTQKVSVHFLFFYLNEKELNQQVFLIKYVENEISTATFHKEKERERERSKNIIQLQKHF